MQYSGRTTALAHKRPDPEDRPWGEVPHNASPALRPVLFLDVQWSDCPVEVENDVKKLWRLEELGNDKYILKMSIDDLLEKVKQNLEIDEWDEETRNWVKRSLTLDYLIDYLRSQGVADDQQVVIHWWW